MAKVIAVHSMKGGVGKSSLAVNLAYAAATAGLRTVLWDIDAQGGATFLLGVEGASRKKERATRIFARDTSAASLARPTAFERLDIIAADLSLRRLDHDLAEADRPKRLRRLIGDLAPSYDCIVLDCPPGLGELSDQIIRAADLLVMPLLPVPVAMRTLEQVRAHIAEHHASRAPPLLPVFSMVDRRKTLHREALASEPDWSAIPHASVVERMAVERRPLASFAAASPAARATHAVWDKVAASLA